MNRHTFISTFNEQSPDPREGYFRLYYLLGPKRQVVDGGPQTVEVHLEVLKSLEELHELADKATVENWVHVYNSSSGYPRFEK